MGQPAAQQTAPAFPAHPPHPFFSRLAAGPPGDGNEYLNILFDHIRQTYPFWNRTNGRDHL